MDLDLRLVRAFVAVADAAHFGRAAQALSLDQSAVSRRVQRLERDLGVALLTRSSRSVRLTDAGRTFLPDARTLLRSAEAARSRLSRHRALDIGFLLGLSPARAVQRLREQGFDGQVRMTQLAHHDQGPALLEHQVDVVLGRLPIVEDGVVAEEVEAEPRGVLLAADHPLAGRPAVVVADLQQEVMVRYRSGRGLHSPADQLFGPRPDVADGPLVAGIEEKLEYAAARIATTLIPLSCAELYHRDDIRVVRVADAPPSRTVVAWAPDVAGSTARPAMVAALREVVGEGGHLHPSPTIRDDDTHATGPAIATG